MSDCYKVSCPFKAELNGLYKRDEGGIFRHVNGDLLLRRQKSGEWSIYSKKVNLCLAEGKYSTSQPSDCKRWHVKAAKSWIETDFTVTKVDDMHAPAAPPAPKPAGTSTKQNQNNRSTSPVPPPVPAPSRAPSSQQEFAAAYAHPVPAPAPPAVKNVGMYSFSVNGVANLSVYSPLRFGNGPTKRMTQEFDASKWATACQLWQNSLVVLDNYLSKQVGLLQEVRRLKEEQKRKQETIERLRANVAQSAQREALAQQRSNNLQQRQGRVHVRRDDANGTGSFPSGQEIRARYEATFGDGFEALALQGCNYLEDVMRGGGDPVEAMVNDVIVPLFRETARYVRNLVEDKYKRLTDAFGLPEGEGVLDKDGEISIVRQYFLTSQQEPLLAAASTVDEATLQRIFSAAGSKAVDMRTNLPTWAARQGYAKGAGTLDLTKMARELLWVQAAIELSDPKCYLFPNPGAAVVYGDNRRINKEVFYAGGKKSRVLGASDRAQVVVPGLYFDVPSTSAPRTAGYKEVVPVVAAKVRRAATEGTIAAGAAGAIQTSVKTGGGVGGGSLKTSGSSKSGGSTSPTPQKSGRRPGR